MSITRLNHASVVAHDLDESISFYEEVLDLEKLPTPNFEVPVAWLGCGEGQLHLFERDVLAPEYHHVGLTTDDFEDVYRTARERNCFANWDDTGSSPIYVLPDEAVQLYLSDPSGNLVEVNWPDVKTLDADIRSQAVDRSNLQDQDGDAARATLGLHGEPP